MLGCQRWREHQPTYRRPDEQVRRNWYEVEPIEERVAKAFVCTHHYSRSYPAGRFPFGLFRGGNLVGVAVYSQPQNNATITGTFAGVQHTDGVDLGRFVLLDSEPGNAETVFLARTHALLRAAGLRGATSFSDPMPRTTLDGRVIHPGHVGTIYQAANAIYLGRRRPELLWLLPDGTAFARRSLTKILGAETGWRGAVARLEVLGAPPLEVDADPMARLHWMQTTQHDLLRPLRHPGNHKYAWRFNRRVQVLCPTPALSYPKKDAA